MQEQYQEQSEEQSQDQSKTCQDSQEESQKESQEEEEIQEGPQKETCLQAPSRSILQPQTEPEINLKIYSCLRCGKDNKTENALESHM